MKVVSEYRVRISATSLAASAGVASRMCIVTALVGLSKQHYRRREGVAHGVECLLRIMSSRRVHLRPSFPVRSSPKSVRLRRASSARCERRRSAAADLAAAQNGVRPNTSAIPSRSMANASCCLCVRRSANLSPWHSQQRARPQPATRCALRKRPGCRSHLQRTGASCVDKCARHVCNVRVLSTAARFMFVCEVSRAVQPRNVCRSDFVMRQRLTQRNRRTLVEQNAHLGRSKRSSRCMGSHSTTGQVNQSIIKGRVSPRHRYV
jgi:hypothetical protein